MGHVRHCFRESGYHFRASIRSSVYIHLPSGSPPHNVTVKGPDRNNLIIFRQASVREITGPLRPLPRRLMLCWHLPVVIVTRSFALIRPWSTKFGVEGRSPEISHASTERRTVIWSHVRFVNGIIERIQISHVFTQRETW